MQRLFPYFWRFIVKRKSNLYIAILLSVGVVFGCLLTPKLNATAGSLDKETLAKLTPQQIESHEQERQNAIKAFVKQGMEFFTKDKFIEAKVQFEKALKLDPTHAEALKYIKECDIALENKKKGIPVVVKQESKPVEKPSLEKENARKEQELAQKQKAEEEAAKKALKIKGDNARSMGYKAITLEKGNYELTDNQLKIKIADSKRLGTKDSQE